MTLEISALGERINLLLQQGAAFGPITATMLNPDETTPVDLTGCTIFGSVRKTAATDTVAAALTVAITTPLAGVYTFQLTGAQTDLITAGEVIKSAESQYVWDLFLKDSTDRVTQLYYGAVQVLRRVTRPTP